MSPTALLQKARTRFSQAELAKMLGRDVRTIRRWETGEIDTPSLVIPALKEIITWENILWESKKEFTFIDLFAWIGGIRLWFESIGGECIYTSEWNDWSVKTYAENFWEKHPIEWDITITDAESIPDHDVLLWWFPCQPFSIAWVSKKNSLGRPHWFECTTQGTLFFDVARIIAWKKPKAFLLENVKNLLSHDKGNTFKVILQTLKDELWYDIHWKVVDGQNWVPQHRERIIIIGFREKTDFSWDDIQYPDYKTSLKDILHKEDWTEKYIESDGDKYVDKKWKVQDKYTLSEKLWKYLQSHAEKHKAKWNWFWFGLVSPENVSRTLSARYYKDGSEILVSRWKWKNPRRLTPRECARLMWFPDSFKIPVSDTQAYRQFGNSVIVPVMKEMARLMKEWINK